jgi:glycosyltransferase involved in cell wall biosynthesis
MTSILPQCAVSVILPFYNAETTLVRSLKSILDQTRPPAQVICINDGSTDKSMEILEGFLQSRPDRDVVTIVNLDINRGVYVARNAGLDAATQPYLAFQDADDFWHPRKLEIQFTVLEADENISLSCHRVDVWPAEKPIIWPELEFDVTKIKPVDSQMSLWVTRLHTDSIIMKNIPKYRFDETMRRGGDMLMWLEVVLSTDWNVYHDVSMAWKAKEHFGAGGLSGNLWKAEMANQYSIRALAKKGLISPGYAAVLRAWCYLKLLRRYMIAGLRKTFSFGKPVHNTFEI